MEKIEDWRQKYVVVRRLLWEYSYTAVMKEVSNEF